MIFLLLAKEKGTLCLQHKVPYKFANKIRYSKNEILYCTHILPDF